MKYNDYSKLEGNIKNCLTITSMAKALLFVPKPAQRWYVKTENEILPYTNKTPYFPNNDSTKWQNEKYLLHKAQQNRY